MGYISLASMAKVSVAGVLAGGILVAGITWQGDGSVSNIKGNVDSLKGKLTTAIDDNVWLSGQFDNLKGLYDSAVSEANSTISGLTGAKTELENQKADLTAQVTGLQGDLTAKQTELDAVLANSSATEVEISEAKDELQTEIDRLSNELDKANKAIAELEAYAQEADTSVQYTAVDRADYSVEAKDVTDADTTVAPVETPEATEPTDTEVVVPEAEPEATPEAVSFITESALAFNKTSAEKLGSEESVNRIEQAFVKSMKTPVDITGVTIFEYTSGSGVKVNYLAYKMDSSKTAMVNIGTPAPTDVLNVKNDAGLSTTTIYFVNDVTGAKIMSIDKNGGITKY